MAPGGGHLRRNIFVAGASLLLVMQCAAAATPRRALLQADSALLAEPKAMRPLPTPPASEPPASDAVANAKPPPEPLQAPVPLLSDGSERAEERDATPANPSPVGVLRRSSSSIGSSPPPDVISVQQHVHERDDATVTVSPNSLTQTIYNGITGLSPGWLSWSWHGDFNTRDTLLPFPFSRAPAPSSQTFSDKVNEQQSRQATTVSSVAASSPPPSPQEQSEIPASLYARIEPYGALALRAPQGFGSYNDDTTSTHHEYLEVSLYVHSDSKGSLYNVHVQFEGTASQSPALPTVPSWFPRAQGFESLRGRWIRIVVPLPSAARSRSDALAAAARQETTAAPWHSVQLVNKGTTPITLNVGAMMLKASRTPVDANLELLT